MATVDQHHAKPSPHAPGVALLLVSVLLIVHAPILVNDGLFGEDWLLFAAKPGYPVQTDFLIHGAGHPFLWLYSTLANLTGHPIAMMKLLALAGIAIGAASLFGFAQRLRIFSAFEAALLTFLVWSYAEFHNWATKLTATYLFSMALLCLGLNLLAILLGSERPRPALRIVGLLAIFCSFSLNSMIAAYYVGLLAALLLIPRADGWKDLPHSSRFLRAADFIVVPFVYWFSTNYFFPKIGPYTGYYKIALPQLAETTKGLANFWRYGFAKLPTEAQSLAGETIWTVLIALLIAAVLVALLARRDRDDAPSMRATAWPFLAAALAFVAFASPYLVSGISPVDHFYECRHLVLFGIPLGLGTIGLCRAANGIVRTRIAGQIIAGLIVTLNLCALWSGYALQQARWLRQEAMIEGLRTAYAEPPAAVFNLDDGFLTTTDQTFYGMTELTGALHVAWDARPLFAFTGRHEGPNILRDIDTALKTEGSAFRNMDPRGPQATITLAPKPPVLSSVRLTMHYYRCLLTSCDKPALLRALADTTVQTGPIPHLAKLP